jgi:hypothetical protein
VYKIHEEYNNSFKGVNWTQFLPPGADTDYMKQTITNYTFEPGQVGS